MDEQRERTEHATQQTVILYGKDRGLGMPVRTLRLRHRKLFVRLHDETYYYSFRVGGTDVYKYE